MTRYFNYGGFDENKVMKYGIDDTDLHILSYIDHCYRFCETLEIEGEKYVCIKMKDMIDENPRIKIAQRTIETKIALLVEKGLLLKFAKCIGNTKSKQTYYLLTDKYDDLITSHADNSIEKPVKIKKKAEPSEPKEKKLKEEKKEDTTKTDKDSNTTHTPAPVLTGVQKKLIDDFTDYQGLKDTIISFIQMRKFIKKPMTDHALEIMLNKLKGMSNNISMQIEILNQSILNNYQGIFPLKESKDKTNKTPYDYNNEECDF